MTLDHRINHQCSLQYQGTDIQVSANVRDSGEDLVLFLHGFGCTKESFDAAFSGDWFGSGFKLCAFDFPGHGASRPLPDTEDLLQAYAEVALTVIAELRPRRIHLVCHSMGGAVGLLVAKELADGRIGSFVCVEGNLVAEDCGLISRHIAEQSREEFQRSGFEAQFSELRFSDRIDLNTWGSWASKCDPGSLHQAASALVEWCDTGQLAKLYRHLSEVATYVYGELSGFPAHLASLVDDDKARMIRRSGHFPMLDNPTEFFASVAALVPAPCPATG